jgi:hypothetical protein
MQNPTVTTVVRSFSLPLKKLSPTSKIGKTPHATISCLELEREGKALHA